MKLYDFGAILLGVIIAGFIGYNLIERDCKEVSTNPSVYECVDKEDMTE